MVYPIKALTWVVVASGWLFLVEILFSSTDAALGVFTMKIDHFHPYVWPWRGHGNSRGNTILWYRCSLGCVSRISFQPTTLRHYLAFATFRHSFLPVVWQLYYVLSQKAFPSSPDILAPLTGFLPSCRLQAPMVSNFIWQSSQV